MTYFKSKSITRLATAGLACALVACAGRSEVTPDAKALASVDQRTEMVAAETFSTEGKPTKAITTPAGNKKIYDPTQDEVVRAAFKRFYNKKYEQTSMYNTAQARGELGDKDADLIFMVKDIHETDALRLGCKVLKNFSCGRTLTYSPFVHPERSQKCPYKPKLDIEGLGKVKTECEELFVKAYYQGATNICSVNGRLRNNMIYFPIGNNFPELETGMKPLMKPLDWKTQLKDFFDFECSGWR